MKERIGQAALSVNRELVWLYWQIERDEQFVPRAAAQIPWLHSQGALQSPT